MKLPRFSVVIPTYNRAAFIEKTLQTVWQQTYPHYEVIVVDNCSTDNTVQLLEPYVRDGRLTLIKHDQNRERAESRNTGMQAASGDFLTLLDSDDLMYPTNLEDAAQYAADHPDCKCFYNLSEMVDEAGRTVYRIKPPALKDQIGSIASGNFMGCTGDFIQREIYTNYQFSTDPLIIGAEDWEFWLRVLAKYKVGRIDKINSGVVHHGGRSVNSQNIATLAEGLRRMVENISRDPELMSVYAKHLKRIEASSMTYLAMLANESGLSRLALTYLKAAAVADLRSMGTRRFLKALQVAMWGRAATQNNPPNRNSTELGNANMN